MQRDTYTLKGSSKYHAAPKITRYSLVFPFLPSTKIVIKKFDYSLQTSKWNFKTLTTLTCYVLFNCFHEVNPIVVGSIAQFLNGERLKRNAIKVHARPVVTPFLSRYHLFRNVTQTIGATFLPPVFFIFQLPLLLYPPRAS